MAHVVLHCAELATPTEAEDAAQQLCHLRDQYARYEASVLLQSSEPPYGDAREPHAVPAPLLDFAARNGFVWPDKAGILLEGFADEIEVLTVDRLVFFYGGGFELGGEGIRRFFAARNALRYATRCHLVVNSEDPTEQAQQLTSFLDDEDFEEQYQLTTDSAVERADFLFSLRLEGGASMRTLCFDDSGVQDHAFTAVLPQLAGSDPSLDPSCADTVTLTARA